MAINGYCDPNACAGGASYFTCGEGVCTFGAGCLTNIPETVPVKQLVKGATMAPWVRIRFESKTCPQNAPDCGGDPAAWDYTEITTGNVSQGDGGCKAVIKAFTYGWGAVNSGNVCRVTIFDEGGDSFQSWFARLPRNPGAASADDGNGMYKMKVTFGWTITGAEDGDVCGNPTTSSPATCNPDGSGASSNGNRLLCSPALWFLPRSIDCQLNNGKMTYVIEGVDLLMQASRCGMQTVYGSSNYHTHFKDAVVKMFADSFPPMNVQFVQMEETGSNVTELLFHQTADQALAGPVVGDAHSHYADPVGAGNPFWWGPPISCSPENTLPGGGCSQSSDLDAPNSYDDLELRGPLGIWPTRNRDPVASLHDWLNQTVLAKIEDGTEALKRIGEGITVNYDSSYTVPDELHTTFNSKGMPIHGRVLIWKDPWPRNNKNFDVPSRLKAVYIVGGGNCSPVLGFSPQFKYYPVGINMGGTMTGASGKIDDANSNRVDAAGNPTIDTVPGETTGNPVPESAMLEGSAKATETVIKATARHLQTNTVVNAIEAELRVQGDPSDWLCSPIYGYGRTVALLVMNGFFLDPKVGDACSLWGQEASGGGTCNKTLTRKNWFIKGVEHSIKEGSFTTTIKIVLMVPGMDTGGRDDGAGQKVFLGADTTGGAADTHLCSSGTWNCPTRIPVGGDDINSGTNTFCDPTCAGVVAS